MSYRKLKLTLEKEQMEILEMTFRVAKCYEVEIDNNLYCYDRYKKLSDNQVMLYQEMSAGTKATIFIISLMLSMMALMYGLDMKIVIASIVAELMIYTYSTK